MLPLENSEPESLFRYVRPLSGKKYRFRNKPVTRVLHCTSTPNLSPLYQRIRYVKCLLLAGYTLLPAPKCRQSNTVKNAPYLHLRMVCRLNTGLQDVHVTLPNFQACNIAPALPVITSLRPGLFIFSSNATRTCSAAVPAANIPAGLAPHYYMLHVVKYQNLKYKDNMNRQSAGTRKILIKSQTCSTCRHYEENSCKFCLYYFIGFYSCKQQEQRSHG